MGRIPVTLASMHKTVAKKSDEGAEPARGERRRRALLGLAASVAVVVAAGLWLLRHGLGTLDASPYALPRGETAAGASWEDILGAPGPVEVEALVTATVHGDRFVVLDPEDPRRARMGDRHAPSVVLAYLVRHRDAGDFLIDAGLAASFAEGAGNYDALLSLLLASMGARAVQARGQDTATQLRARGARPRAVFLTHLHADHTSGLADLDLGISAVFGLGESTFAQRALLGDHLAGRALRTLDLRRAPRRTPFEGALDLLGDGSLWALATPGHSPAHVSYLVNGPRPLLITGDAAAYHAQLEHRIAPAPGVADPARARRSLDALADFHERFPQVGVAVGHEQPIRP